MASVPNTDTFSLQDVVGVVNPGVVARVDKVTKNSTSGDCTVGCNGYSYLMSWNTTAQITVGNFVTDHSGDFGAVTLTDNGDGSMLFTANVPGTDFAAATITAGLGTAVNLVANHGLDSDLQSCFDDAIIANFHPAYYPDYEGGISDSQLNFRAYADGVTDYDGNFYKTMIIGNQEWIMSNLKVTHYANGDAIYNNLWTGDVNDTGGYYNNGVYGNIYNFWAMSGGLPAFWRNGTYESGWHVPTEAEWSTLFTALSGAGVAGGKLKETGTSHWTTPNTSATDEYFLTFLPGGWWPHTGSYPPMSDVGSIGSWWSSTPWYFYSIDGYITPESIPFGTYIDGGSAYSAHYNNDDITAYIHHGNCGFAIRCVRTLS